jgi:phosphoribosyl-ATP pyrophosphohydrolase/phosphoribosyl-AMP cyclohydrolase
MVVQTARDAAKVRFDEKGLVPCVMQDARSGEVVRQIRYDCDGDALVALVDPVGPACHTGERSCFYRDLEGSADPGVDAPGVVGEPALLPYEALAALERTLVARQRKRPAGSYTVELLEDSKLAGDKVREEAAEVVKAVNSESEERVAEEGADVVYHLAVLLLSRGLSMAEVLHVLNGRRAAR